MKTPPHLPPKSCSLPLYKRIRQVESILFIAGLSFVSGIVGGIISDVYITPDYNFYYGVARGQYVIPKVVEQVPDALFVREQYRQTLSLVQKKIYEKSARVSPDTAITAVFISDTGWFVAPSPANGMQAQNWLAITSDGAVYTIKNIILDTEEELVYGSIEGEGFRVVSFPFLDALDSGKGLWIGKNGRLERSVLAYPSLWRDDSSNIYRPGEVAYAFRVLDIAPLGSVVWTEDGKFFGFVDKNGTIKPWFVIKSVYTNVFAGKQIVHTVLPVQGYIVMLSENESVLAGGRYGFYIERVDAGVDNLKKGDVIVAFNGESLVPWLFSANIELHTGDSATISVLRDSNLLDQQIGIVQK